MGSMLLSSAVYVLRVHVSQEYRNTDMPNAHINLILDPRAMTLFFHIGFSIVSAAVVYAIPEIIPGDGPFVGDN